MPAYIKWYYAFAVYLLLCSACIGICLTYNVIRHHAGRGLAGLIATLIIYAGLIVTLLKGVVSIKVCRHYRQGLQLTSQQQDVLMAAWWYIIFFTLGALLYCVVIIQEYGGRSFRYFESHFKTSLMDSCILLGTIAGIYFSITDLILLKAIRKKHEESLLSFEVQ